MAARLPWIVLRWLCYGAAVITLLADGPPAVVGAWQPDHFEQIEAVLLRAALMLILGRVVVRELQSGWAGQKGDG